jgi:hypothetical protein
MSDSSTTRLIEMYLEEASAPLFFSGFFKSPPKNFHNSEKVEIDVIRDDEDVAIVVQDLSTGARNNENSLYTNKAFTPPILWEKGSVHAFTQMRRVAGVDPFTDPSYGAQAVEETFRMYRKLERKVRRTVEMMASQIFSSGTLTMTDAAGTALYSLDFQPKASHFAVVSDGDYSTTWATDGSTGDPLADLGVLAQIIRRDGKKNPSKLVFGTSAFQRFIANANVKSQLDNTRMRMGEIAPVARGEGATFQGFIWVGHYRFEMWTYDGFYRDPVTTSLTPYVNDDHVIMLCDDGRLDLTYGAIPRIVSPDPRVSSFLPGRISSASAGIDLNPWAYVSPDGTNVTVEVGTRPLPIPTAIDTFGRLDVTA